jgi:membrane-associated phospholipid phosphatase
VILYYRRILVQVFGRMMQIRFLASSLMLMVSSGVAKADSLENIGTALAIAMPATAFASTFYMDDAEGRKQFYPAFLTNVVATEGLKYAVKRERPDGSDKHSFPSAHTSVSFQSAAFIHQRYGFEYAAPAYVLAAFVGYSRVASDRHYTSDVLAGAALGIASSFYFVEPYTKAVITPALSEGQYGVQLAAKW